MFLVQDHDSDTLEEDRPSDDTVDKLTRQAGKNEDKSEKLSLTDLPESIQLRILGRLTCSELADVGKCCKQLYRCLRKYFYPEFKIVRCA